MAWLSQNQSLRHHYLVLHLLVCLCSCYARHFLHPQIQDIHVDVYMLSVIGQLGKPTGLVPFWYTLILISPLFVSLTDGLLSLVSLWVPVAPQTLQGYTPQSETMLCTWCECNLSTAYDIWNSLGRQGGVIQLFMCFPLGLMLLSQLQQYSLWFYITP